MASDWFDPLGGGAAAAQLVRGRGFRSIDTGYVGMMRPRLLSSD